MMGAESRLAMYKASALPACFLGSVFISLASYVQYLNKVFFLPLIFPVRDLLNSIKRSVSFTGDSFFIFGFWSIVGGVHEILLAGLRDHMGYRGSNSGQHRARQMPFPAVLSLKPCLKIILFVFGTKNLVLIVLRATSWLSVYRSYLAGVWNFRHCW